MNAKPSPTAPKNGIAGRLTPKHLIVMLITTILVVGQWRYGILRGYEPLVICLGAAMLTELFLSRFLLGRFVPLLSAYVSGTSLTLLLKPQLGLVWPFIVGAGIAIGSKYVLRYRGRHLWNPTNLAIAVLLLLAPSQLTILSHEFGNELATNLIVCTVGLIVAGRARILHVTATYVLAFLAFAGLRVLISGQGYVTEITPLTGPMYQLFIFFMITDPPTTIPDRRARIVVAVLVAAVESVLRTANDLGYAWAAPFGPAPPIFALAIVGPLALAWWLTFRAPAPAPAARAESGAARRA